MNSKNKGLKRFKSGYLMSITVLSILINIFMASFTVNTVYAEGEERLDVPFFRQIWEPWGKQNLGTSNDLIENSGCALTSLAMVFKYYGMDTEPGKLNEWLKDNKGFMGTSSIIWSKAAEMSEGSITYLGMENYKGSADLEKINWLLDSACPVIAKMEYEGTNHYVVISGRSGSAYYINDPWCEDPSRTVNESYKPYGDPAQSIKGIVMFTHTNPVPPRIPVTSVKSIFSEGSYKLIHPMKNPEIVLRIGDPYMTVNGKKKEIDKGNGTTPVLYKDRTLLPIRAVMEEMDGSLEWDEKNEKITIEVQGRTIELWKGKRTAFVNGWEFVLDAEPQIINSRTMVPLRFIVEKLGCVIEWQEKTNTIIIKSNN